MAIEKLPSGSWRAVVGSGKNRTSETFPKKALALDWEAAEKARRIALKANPVEEAPKPTGWGMTLKDLLEKYVKEETPKKESAKAEKLRLEKLLRDYPDLGAMRIDELLPVHFDAWRDDRLRKVQSGSVRREYTSLRAAIIHARDVWRWHMPQDPLRGFKPPADSPLRTEIWGWRDIRAYFVAAGYRPGCKLGLGQQEAAFAFHLTLRTALRSGEILQLGSATIRWGTKVAVIPNHKTRHRTHKAKTVPLFRRALRLLAPYRAQAQIFTISDEVRDVKFRAARDTVPWIKHLHFHDGRATCLSLLSKRMPVEVLQKVSDHEDLNTLVDRYYRVTPEAIAEQYAG
jgi:hypothetical protein